MTKRIVDESLLGQALEVLDKGRFLEDDVPLVEATCDELRSALDGDAVEPVAFSQFLSDVVTAAGLLSHGKQSKALATRISEAAMRYMAAPQPAQKVEPLTWPQICAALMTVFIGQYDDYNSLEEASESDPEREEITKVVRAIEAAQKVEVKRD